MLKQMVVRVPADLLKAAKMAALERDISLQELITRMLAAHMRKGAKR